MKREKKKILRVIFKGYDSDVLNNTSVPLYQKLVVIFGKLLTIPLGYEGIAYDHVEIITPNKERFSIRLEETPKNGKQKLGVFLIPKDGLNNLKNKDLILNNTFRDDPVRYKLFFGFHITDEEEIKMYEFISQHIGEQYSLITATTNFFLRKLGLRKLIINPYLHMQKHKPEWDCVSLIIRCLNHIGILNIPDNDFLGMSAFDFAQYMISECRKLSWGINTKNSKLKILVSNELNPNSYKELLKNEHEIGSKRSREFSSIMDGTFTNINDVELEEDVTDQRALLKNSDIIKK